MSLTQEGDVFNHYQVHITLIQLNIYYLYDTLNVNNCSIGDTWWHIWPRPPAASASERLSRSRDLAARIAPESGERKGGEGGGEGGRRRGRKGQEGVGVMTEGVRVMTEGVMVMTRTAQEVGLITGTGIQELPYLTERISRSRISRSGLRRLRERGMGAPAPVGRCSGAELWLVHFCPRDASVLAGVYVSVSHRSKQPAPAHLCKQARARA